MIFTTQRMIVRKALPTSEDTEMFFRLWTDGRVMANVGFPNGLRITRDEIRKRLESQRASEYDQLLVIQRQSDGQRLGECKLGMPNEQGIAETDIKLLPDHWGHSYGVEVKRGLLDYLFTHTDCRVVQASPNVNNIPSIRMQEAVGGVRVNEGVYEFPENMRAFTTPVHCYIYEVTRQTWATLPRAQTSGKITIQIKPRRELSPADQKPLNKLLHRVFSNDPFNTMSWSKMDWNVLVYVDDVLASNVEIVQRTVTVNGVPVHVGGIGGVATLPEYRGRGLATRAMSAADKFMKDELGLEYGLLITGTRRKSYYEGLHWMVISDPVYFDQPSGKMENDGIAMSLALAVKPWPPGVVDFCGLPW
jgi:RimJ/RimL family protein N-acetyltransferase